MVQAEIHPVRRVLDRWVLGFGAAFMLGAGAQIADAVPKHPIFISTSVGQTISSSVDGLDPQMQYPIPLRKTEELLSSAWVPITNSIGDVNQGVSCGLLPGGAITAVAISQTRERVRYTAPRSALSVYACPTGVELDVVVNPQLQAELN
jgi:hypothetical protein